MKPNILISSRKKTFEKSQNGTAGFASNLESCNILFSLWFWLNHESRLPFSEMLNLNLRSFQKGRITLNGISIIWHLCWSISRRVHGIILHVCCPSVPQDNTRLHLNDTTNTPMIPITVSVPTDFKTISSAPYLHKIGILSVKVSTDWEN